MKKGEMVSSFLLGSVCAALLWTLTENPRTFAGTDYEELALLSNVLHLVEQNYVEEVDEHQLIEGALRGMLDTLDPHTSYLSEESFREMQLDTRGEFEGLGIEISKSKTEGFVTVVSPIDGTPAARAGLMAQDRIVAVCPDATDETCKSTQNMDLIEAVQLMRGPRGTEIMIRILRKGWDVPKPFLIRRDSIKVPSVYMYSIDDSLVYLRLSQFTERASDDIREKLEEAREKLDHEIGGLVLDLRDNPGGLLDQAVKVADLFLQESDGVIVSSVGRGGAGRMEWKATSEGTEPAYPIVVLVNGGSASASEIVAGALQDRKRGFVVGTETFGKGSVQTIIPLNGGRSGLRLTTQLYYLPSGRSIQKVRIQPDLVVQQFSTDMVAALEKENAERQRSFGEEDLEGHLSSPKAIGNPGTLKKTIGKETEEKQSDSAAEGDAPLTREQAFRRALQVDRQLMQAVALLKSAPIFSRVYQSQPNS